MQIWENLLIPQCSAQNESSHTINGTHRWMATIILIQFSLGFLRIQYYNPMTYSFDKYSILQVFRLQIKGRTGKNWQNGTLLAGKICDLEGIKGVIANFLMAWGSIFFLLIKLTVIHTLREHYAYAAANLTSGYSKYAKVARVY